MDKNMWAAVYYGPQDLRIEEVPLPEIGAGEILLKIDSASICGTDLRIYHGAHRKFPPGTRRIPGHEVAGTIAAAGNHVTGYDTGQRVFAAPNMGCGYCRECISGNNNRCASYQAFGVTIDGGFAEYMRIPAQSIQQGNIMPIASTVDPAEAALIEPFACVLRGQDALNIRPGDVVLVMGAGPIGIMHTKLARLSGAARVLVSEPNPARAQQAEHLGADRAINPAQEDLPAILDQETGGQGADVIIVAAPSHAAQESALQLAAIGGRINFFGGLPKNQPTINFDSNLVHYKELLITGTTACSTSDCRRAAQIISSGRVSLADLISKRFPLAQAVTAFAAAEDGNSLKIVLEP
ncbi:MAG: alcohol dehydrogenase catalytic domain-containing protein [Anaerolineaceae bacterium]|nr:alcohol dehydrogenase catalytic domain-containing protein [Anaerolineaceae bacterium]